MVEAILVKFDQLRHHLLPCMCSVAWQVTSHRDTMMRPLVMDFRTDAGAVEVADQFTFGREILVRSVVTAGAASW
jgi:alpha-D-xyloside xylohydrolase